MSFSHKILEYNLYKYSMRRYQYTQANLLCNQRLNYILRIYITSIRCQTCNPNSKLNSIAYNLNYSIN